LDETINMKIRTGHILALCLLVGCAVSRKVEYEDVYANVPAFKQRIALACWDQREQVVNGSRMPDFVGYTRSGAGIAYPMGTANGMPFTDNMTSSISVSLSKKGSTVANVTTQFNEQESLIISQLKKTRSNRLILIDCREFHTDGYGATSLMYNLQVNIYGEQGDLLKQKTFSGKRALGGSVAWGPGKYKEYMPEAFKKLIEEMFNDPEISSALQN
jgi:hypothetical protein